MFKATVSSIRQLAKRSIGLDRLQKKFKAHSTKLGTSNAIMTAALVADATNRSGSTAPPPQTRPAPNPMAIDRQFKQLEAKLPLVYPVWKQLYENGIHAYDEDPDSSCSRVGNHYVRLFSAYLKIYTQGQLLDIGCGAEGCPGYLAHYPPSLICGVDPRPPKWTPNFEYVQGFNEFLPWGDGTFDTVVSGTSLDHVLCLDTSLEEVRRVLKPSGRYLVWLASVPGALPYNPQAEHPQAIDKFHLFHFERSWFEPMLEKYFQIIDISVLPHTSFDHVFYAMTPRPRN